MFPMALVCVADQAQSDQRTAMRREGDRGYIAFIMGDIVRHMFGKKMGSGPEQILGF